MISSFRRYLETWYVRAFFLLMVAAFVLWGVGDMLRFVGTGTWAAKVGGTTIEPQTLDIEYRRALSAAARDLPSGQEPSTEMKRQVADQALQRLIDQEAVNQELRDLRIVVPQPIMLETIRKLPAFQTPEGGFDRARFESALRANGLTESGFLQMARSDMARQQLMDAVTAGARAPDTETGPIYAARFEKRSADIVAFPIAAMPEPPIPDEATARRWYDNHPDLYATPEYRRVKVIVLSTGTEASGVSVTESELQAAYEEHVSEYTTTAKRAARVISTTDAAKATELADQWRAGADWPTMEAAAKAAGAAAIEQDQAAEKQYPDPDLAKAVFTTPPDTIPPPIKGALGWFVIQVTKASEGGTAPFEQVKDKLRDRVVTERALDLVYDQANKIDGQLANGMTLETLPVTPGVAAATVTVDQHGFAPDETLAALPGEQEIRDAIIKAAFDTRKGDPPHLTEVQTPSTGGSGYYAVSVEDITPVGEKPFDTVHNSVNEDWRADQRRHSAEVAAAAMLAAVKGGRAFSDAARDAGVTPKLSPLVSRGQRDPGMPPEVQQVLFSLKQGEPTMVEGAEGFLVAVPVEIVAPDPTTDQAGYDQLRAAIAKSVANDLTQTFEEALRQRANPRINQETIDQIVQP